MAKEFKAGKTILVGAVVGLAVFFVFTVLSSMTGYAGKAPVVYQCSDGIDNDHDGFCDYGTRARCTDGSQPGDSGCSSKTDNTECSASPEVCDNKDNDCDGSVDEDLGSTTCGTGICLRTVQNCVTGQVQTCTPGNPSLETCNNLDDDCDGSTDESLTMQCGVSDVGACQFGTQTCALGAWGSCVGAIYPTAEVCDGVLDNDCDGVVDDGCLCTNGQTKSCGSDTGACQSGTQTCNNGNWSACTGGIGPTAEICDGIDNDCDTLTDENLGSTTCGVGACQRTAENCVGGTPNACTPGTPTTEICDGTIDNDCDGSVDEGCNCINGQTRVCGSDVGECQSGTQTCVNGDWDVCQGAVGPTTEVCDSRDNDCDFFTDEGGVCNSCTDTDGGFVVNVVGTVSGMNMTGPYSFTDACMNGITLREYYCSGTSYYSTLWTCNGTYRNCSMGRCI